jgi:di/tricarboxylate transporter
VCVRKNTIAKQLLSSDEMTKAIDWNMVLLFGGGNGGLVLSLGIESSSIFPWIDTCVMRTSLTLRIYYTLSLSLY